MTRILAAVVVVLSWSDVLIAQVSQERETGPFKAIENRSSVDLFIYQGASPRVVVEADESAVGKVQTWVEGDVLIVDLDRCPMSVRTLKAHITVTDLERLIVNGSGNVTTEMPLNSPHLDVKVNGSGDVSLKIAVGELSLRLNGSGDADVQGTSRTSFIAVNGSGDLDFEGGTMEACTVKLAGSGDIEVSGSTGTLEIKHISSGDLDAGKLLAGSCSIEKSGSGDTSVWVDGDLSIDASGSGDVYYRGKAHIMSLNVTGSGEVSQIH
ncbi:MAG TPA: head GIN domain-containing protein [Bacteroidales bacterium]|nr:head GIN domain-containing protein [Bacteroidales bacterium]